MNKKIPVKMTKYIQGTPWIKWLISKECLNSLQTALISQLLLLTYQIVKKNAFFLYLQRISGELWFGCEMVAIFGYYSKSKGIRRSCLKSRRYRRSLLCSCVRTLFFLHSRDLVKSCVEHWAAQLHGPLPWTSFLWIQHWKSSKLDFFEKTFY